MANIPMVKPRRVLPTSPINIFAGCQFQIRNPKVAAARNNGRFTLIRKNAAKQIKIVSTLRYPSIPSRKLKRFVSQTMPTTAEILNIIGEYKTAKPKSISEKPPRLNTARDIKMNCIINLTLGGIETRSSINPITAIGKPQSRASAN